MSDALPNCPICLKSIDPERESIRHQRCAERLDANLADIPGLYALMGDVLAPGTAGDRTRVSGTRTAPLPVRLEPLSLRARGGIVTVLATWEADWRETRGMAPAERGTSERDLAAIVMWLRAHLPWAVEYHAGIREFADEVRDVVRECHAAAGLLPSMMRIGCCPALVEGETCGTVLRVDPQAEEIRCRKCRNCWPKDRWMLLGKTLRGEETIAA